MSVMCKNTMSKLRESVKKEGLTVVASKGHGKTNTLMCVVSELNGEGIPIIIDYTSQHCFKLPFEVKFLNESYWRKPRIEINKPIILDFSQTTKELAGEILRDIIKKEYLKRVKIVIEGFREGKDREEILKGFKWLVFCLEEAQDLIGRYLKSDDDLATAMNCGRNYKITFVYLTQRLADLATSLVERCSYLIGKQTSDNNLRKISRILGISRKKLKFIETLPKGSFIFYNGERVERLDFPKFLGFGRAYEVKRTIIKRKSPKESLWARLKDSFKPKIKDVIETTEQDSEEASEQDSEENEEYKEDFSNEEYDWDEFLTTEEEWE